MRSKGPVMENFSFDAANLEASLTDFVAKALAYAPKLVLAILVLIFGLWGIRIANGLLGKALDRRHLDESLKPFLKSLLSITLKIALFIAVIGMLGVQTTSFVAILGAAGLAIGLSLQGSLGNLAGGVLILVFRPFKVGDFIETQGLSGTVKEIQIFNSVLITPANQRVIMPNGSLANSNMTNYSAETTRRLDHTFGVSYSDSIPKVKEVLRAIAAEDSRILKDPEPMIAVSGLADSSVNFLFRVWTPSSEYWNVHFDTIEKVKIRFDEAGISIPFPQRDVHYIPVKDVATQSKQSAS